MPATVLVIDDDMEIVQLLKANLEEEGYHVVTGYDGQMAVHLAKTRKPQLIIMDVSMPMTSGLKALEFLRRLPETRDIPVIFLTGNRSEDVYPLIASAPRVAFIKKPTDLEQMNSLVHHFLERYPANV